MDDLINYKGDDCDIVYKNIFGNDEDEDRDPINKIRKNVRELWEKFKPFADPHFVGEFRRKPNQRYWEMYLGCCLLERGFSLQQSGHGPDFCFVLDNKKVWIEAITPTQGSEGHPDRIPEMKMGIAQSVPKEKILLRYRSALDEKEKKFRSYVEKGLVAEEDIKIIAISGGELRRWPDSDTLPFILGAVFPIGAVYVNLSRKTFEIVEQGRHFNPSVKKENGVEVETLFFSDPAHSDISAVIYCGSDIGNPPSIRGEDLILVHNPLAKNPMPLKSLKMPIEFWAEDVGDSWALRNIGLDS